MQGNNPRGIEFLSDLFTEVNLFLNIIQVDAVSNVMFTENIKGNISAWFIQKNSLKSKETAERLMYIIKEMETIFANELVCKYILTAK